MDRIHTPHRSRFPLYGWLVLVALSSAWGYQPEQADLESPVDAGLTVPAVAENNPIATRCAARKTAVAAPHETTCFPPTTTGPGHTTEVQRPVRSAGTLRGNDRSPPSGIILPVEYREPSPGVSTSGLASGKPTGSRHAVPADYAETMSPLLGPGMPPAGDHPARDEPGDAVEGASPPALLPWAPDVPVRRSQQLEQAAREADRHSRRGYELASRRAPFAARLEFLEALRVLSQGLDQERQTRKHSQSLAAGWRALEEAEDFLPQTGRLEADIDLATIVEAHRTPVLKTAPLETLTPLAAFQQYLTFAQEQLAQSTAGEVAGSMALRGLGKVYAGLRHDQAALIAAPEAKAVTLYQASLMAWPENYMAANDLGVLLARGGRLEDARRALQRSVQIQPAAASWWNLALVYSKLGEREQAVTAVYHSRQLLPEGEQFKRWSDAVRWVPPQLLVENRNTQLSPIPAAQRVAGALSPGASQPTVTEAPSPEEAAKSKSGFWPRLSLSSLLTSKESRAEPSSDTATVPRGNSRGYQPVVANAARVGSEITGPTLVEPTVPLRRPTPAPDDLADTPSQATTPAAPCPRCAVDCSQCDWSRRGGWERARAIAWQRYAQGEYVGRSRTAHVEDYRLRVDDQIEMIYRLTREEMDRPYRLNVGDEIRIESVADPTLARDLIIQPDGTITSRLLGQVEATGLTVDQLREKLDRLYRQYYNVPAVTVTPLKVNSKLEDLRATVDRRSGVGGQSQTVRITPEGTIALPAVGTVRAQGLTLQELQEELNERYREEIQGIEVIPVLAERAPRYVYVLGEVGTPGRFELTGPTTVLQALSMAGSWNNGANLRQIVVFRRGDDWRLMATMLDLHATLHGKKACPADEIWLSDSDVIIVPKSFILAADDFIELVFTRGIYGVFPMTANVNFAKLSTI